MANWTHLFAKHRCDRKKAYPSQGFARKVAWNASLRAKKPIVDYKCPDCSAWHVGRASAEMAKELQPELDEAILKLRKVQEDRAARIARTVITDLVVPDKPRTTPAIEKTGHRVEPMLAERPHHVAVVHVDRNVPIKMAKPKQSKKDSCPGPARTESPYKVYPGMVHGYMTAIDPAGPGHWFCVCVCGTQETRRNKTMQKENTLDCCRECNKVAGWLRNGSGDKADTELFVDDAVRFTLEAIHERNSVREQNTNS